MNLSYLYVSLLIQNALVELIQPLYSKTTWTTENLQRLHINIFWQ